jgi:aminopeptidase N
MNLTRTNNPIQRRRRTILNRRGIAVLGAMALLRLFSVHPQLLAQPFARADTLRGALSPERTCYDVTYEHLDVRIDPSDSSLKGSNAITFRVVEPFRKMQIDLFDNMNIEKITLDGATSPLPFAREFNAVFIEIPEGVMKTGVLHTLTVFYGGRPLVAKRPPWLGGFSWEKDSTGNPWVVVTCQGTGASCWWPNKDHQSDEPDSMMISVTVPPGLMEVSNGRLRSTTTLPDGWTRFDWFVGSPINNYCVTVNVGKYAHFADRTGSRDTLTLDYYVLPQNLERAKKHFEQVKGMMRAFEKYFGPYPFPRDGYKLVECPHTGMEHQSAVAYGNWFLGGYRGRAPSEAGLKFDFIIIHESAHEWWGNSVTAKDVADMWIHESFGAYAEALYVEELYGYPEAMKYVNGKRPGVGNREPIIGVYNVNREGSGDMYNKGQLMLNTLRHVIDNDSLWIQVLRGIQRKYRWQTVTADTIFSYVGEITGTDYRYFFEQYLRFPKIPLLEVFVSKKGSNVTARYRWKTDVRDFRMPVRATLESGKFDWIRPTTSWQEVKLKGIEPPDFRVEEDRFYVDVKLGWVYLDERLKPEVSLP